jgi:hypothetical protein
MFKLQLLHKRSVIILIIIFSFLCICKSNGQTLGYKEGPDVTLTKYNPSPNLGYTYGIFYDFNAYHNLGISTGLQYSYFKLGGFFVFSQESYYPSYSSTAGGILFKVLELPLNATLRITGTDSSECMLYLTGGYSFCYILKKQLIQDGVLLENQENVVNSLFTNNTINYATVGLELRLFPQEKLNFALGIQYKYIFANNRQYGDINNWNIYLKTGINLSRLKQKRLMNKNY